MRFGRDDIERTSLPALAKKEQTTEVFPDGINAPEPKCEISSSSAATTGVFPRICNAFNVQILEIFSIAVVEDFNGKETLGEVLRLHLHTGTDQSHLPKFQSALIPLTPRPTLARRIGVKSYSKSGPQIRLPSPR